jgi:hypothetical protein
VKSSFWRKPSPAPASPPARLGPFPAFIAGGAFGFLVAALLAPRRRGEGADEPRVLAGGWVQLAQAWGEAMEAWAAMIPEKAPIPVDLEVLSRRVRTLPGGVSVSLALLDSGIVEVTGEVESESEARTLLEAIGSEPGVRVVLNRIWLHPTPTALQAIRTPNGGSRAGGSREGTHPAN